mmetsp:Transcript_26574/g.68274  ORF Transcript_26574/g.68274 Transcript_26574/m.68274 type:complete len:305 (+) Transcript_26574:393-1307(+)
MDGAARAAAGGGGRPEARSSAAAQQRAPARARFRQAWPRRRGGADERHGGDHGGGSHGLRGAGRGSRHRSRCRRSLRRSRGCGRCRFGRRLGSGRRGSRQEPGSAGCAAAKVVAGGASGAERGGGGAGRGAAGAPHAAQRAPRGHQPDGQAGGEPGGDARGPLFDPALPPAWCAAPGQFRCRGARLGRRQQPWPPSGFPAGGEAPRRQPGQAQRVASTADWHVCGGGPLLQVPARQEHRQGSAPGRPRPQRPDPWAATSTGTRLRRAGQLRAPALLGRWKLWRWQRPTYRAQEPAGRCPAQCVG